MLEHTISDDGHVRIPLQFAFPLYGRVFTESFMFSNGVVGFMSPQTGFCCNGEPLSTNLHPQFNYSIMPLWTDLVNSGSGRFLSQGTPQYQRYGWENISQYGRPESRNTFGVEIKPSGSIDFNYSLIDINGPVTSGVVGDASRGEFIQNYHGNGLTINQIPSLISVLPSSLCLSDPLSNPNCPGYQEAYTAQQCSANPLYNQTCSGYQDAYLNQQCNLNPLFSRDCPGYETAYFTYQCNANPLYSVNCSGYERAYFDYQCNANALYNSQCPGYEQAYFNQQCSLSPLYNNNCPGYQEAYFSQQCSINSLYNTACPGYQQAYFNQQCSLNTLYNVACPGYAQAYYSQQCKVSALYDSGCPGYATAYFNQQCSISPLYNQRCDGYANAYFNQQCSLNTLYNAQCPGYAVAFYNQQCSLSALYDTGCPGYAKAFFDKQCSDSALYNNQCPGYAAAYAKTYVLPKANTVTVSAIKAPEEINKVDVVENRVRDMAVVPVEVPQPQPVPVVVLRLPEPRQQENTKAIADNPRAVAQVKQMMLKPKSLDEQIKLQGILLQSMNNPAFAAYSNVKLVDAQFYKSENPYSQIVMPVNRRTLQGLSSDRLHNELVNSQYLRGN